MAYQAEICRPVWGKGLQSLHAVNSACLSLSSFTSQCAGRSVETDSRTRRANSQPRSYSVCRTKAVLEHRHKPPPASPHSCPFPRAHVGGLFFLLRNNLHSVKGTNHDSTTCWTDTRVTVTLSKVHHSRKFPCIPCPSIYPTPELASILTSIIRDWFAVLDHQVNVVTQ